MKEPQEYERRILLAVTGLSPQVLTETLYALTVQQENPFVPTEIHLVTTREGADRARLMLLDPHEGRFYQFIEEYGIKGERINFNADSIHVVVGPGGEPLRDINTESDNISVANHIVRLVRSLTSDPEAAVHASIAGGRKTMGFYLGYALSLYGRPQDRLSHVLVNSPFESDYQFYYPPAKPQRMIIREQPVHTSDARIMLADIPFVRMREGLPESLRKGEAEFRETVVRIQKAFEAPSLVIDLAEKVVVASEERIELPDTQLAFYAWLALRRQNEKPEVRWGEGRELVEEYLEIYDFVCGAFSARVISQEEKFKEGFPKGWFEQTRSKVNRSLKEALGELLAQRYLIQSIGERRHTRYGLDLPPSAIEVRSSTGAKPWR